MRLFSGFRLGLVLTIVLATAACSKESEPTPPLVTTPPGTGGSGAGGGTSGTGGEGGMVPFVVTSSAFDEGGTIPLQHECGPPLVPMGPGDDVSPDLTWTAGPPGTQSYAVVMRDRDAMFGAYPEGLIHWVIYDIPASVTALLQGIPEGFTVADPAGAKQAEIQGASYFGFFGPCSDSSTNTYEFTVHAMGEASLPVTQTTTEIDVAALIESTSLASTSLSGES